MKEQLILVSGPPGAGKTALLEQFSGHVPEPARRVLAAERAAGGTGTGDQDPARFVGLMLDMAMADHAAATARGETVLFDRGLPDLLAFADWYGLPGAEIERACRRFRYAPHVFWLPAWQDIYAPDAERTLDFAGASAFGDRLKIAYARAGYTLIDVPLGTVSERAAFVARTMILA